MERVLGVIPMLRSTGNLTDSLSAALLKVRAVVRLSPERFWVRSPVWAAKVP